MMTPSYSSSTAAFAQNSRIMTFLPSFLPKAMLVNPTTSPGLTVPSAVLQTSGTQKDFQSDHDSRKKDNSSYRVAQLIEPDSIAYDTEDDLCVLYGGSYDFAENSLSSETWVYDYTSNCWNSTTPSTNPGARCRATLVYDENSDVFVLFGGKVGGNKLNDTWAYDIDIVTTTPTTPTTPLDGPFLPELTMLAIGAGVIVLVLVIVLFIRKR